MIVVDYKVQTETQQQQPSNSIEINAEQCQSLRRTSEKKKRGRERILEKSCKKKIQLVVRFIFFFALSLSQNKRF